MRRILLASAAAAGLALTSLTAQAQTPDPVPVTPPVTTPAPDGEATPEEQIAPNVATPSAVDSSETDAEAAVTADPPSAAADAPVAPANAASVCQSRTTTVHFGRGANLSQENRNAIEHAVDAASVCDLQQVVITDSAEGGVSARRTAAVQAALIRQGVPEDRITVSETANADAEAARTGRLDVQMTFAGVADAGQPSAENAPPQPVS